MKLSEHFTLEEMIFSDTALRHGIDNTPNQEQIIKLTYLASKMEEVRVLTGALHINSGYRCLALNRALKSKDTSQHLKCEADDARSLVGLTALQLCMMVSTSTIRFDQLIYEFESWMHISFVNEADGRKPRHSIITINHRGIFPGIVV